MLKFNTFSAESENQLFMYKLMVSTIVPRPIAWVTTLNQDGSVNAAPYSFFNGVTSKPPTLMFSVARKPDGTKKDTLINIEHRNEFTVNTVPFESFEAMVDTAASFDYGDSEVSRMNLSLLDPVKIKTPRLAQTKVQFECKLLKSVDIGEGDQIGATVVFGKILCINILHGLLDDKDRMKYSELNAIGRLGGVSYCRLGEEIQKQIPDPLSFTKID
jgi:flavin reductase (DIM6/NTAB) family NADH-FMN oxidoreductase RutF